MVIWTKPSLGCRQDEREITAVGLLEQANTPKHGILTGIFSQMAHGQGQIKDVC
jgi:hypothetical protein